MNELKNVFHVEHDVVNEENDHVGIKGVGGGDEWV
jgi:hypothetical protein